MEMREICWNQDWQFAEIDHFTNPNSRDVSQLQFCDVNLPHTCKELPLDSFDERVTLGHWLYCKDLIWKKEYETRRLALRFDGVMCCADVVVNGKLITRHEGGFTPFTAELTDALIPNETNKIEVWVDSTENPKVAPFGGVLDYLTFGGIYRDVYLMVTEKEYVSSCKIWSEDLLSAQPNVKATVEVSKSAAEVGGKLVLNLLDKNNNTVRSLEQQISVGQSSYSFETDFAKDELELWSVDAPTRYRVEVVLTAANDHTDCYEFYTGFRHAEFTVNGFYLNGKKLDLVGTNHHQAFPYIGYAAPKRLQRKDADILKYELGLNIARTSHYPQSPHFIERCDEIGLLVFEELPGWHHIGDDAWKENAKLQLSEMIRRDWNSPSIVLWGVRVNESLDDHDFYLETNALSHELDPTRQTAGVRAIENSEFLEDVFTFNEFIYDGETVPIRQQKLITGLDKDVPYLITEFAGHMYPAKRYDAEERLMEHALRHATVQDAVLGDDTVCGAICWCAFDYNTHCEFGAGNRTCYHGLMDAFRLPKYAAAFYESQISPKIRRVLRPATIAAMGERSKSGLCPIVVFTNLERVKLYSGEQFLGEFFPDRERFPNLLHPPIIAQEGLNFLWGDYWQGIRVEGYVGDEMVEVVNFARDPYTAGITAVADDEVLTADGSDMTRVIISLVDQNGNLMVYNSAVARLRLEGDATLVGSKYLPLLGGSVACWIRAGKTEGAVKLFVETDTHKALPVEISLKK